MCLWQKTKMLSGKKLGVMSILNGYAVLQTPRVGRFILLQINYKGEYHYRSGSTKQQLKGQALNHGTVCLCRA